MGTQHSPPPHASGNETHGASLTEKFLPTAQLAPSPESPEPCRKMMVESCVPSVGSMTTDASRARGDAVLIFGSLLARSVSAHCAPLLPADSGRASAERAEVRSSHG